VRPEARVMGSGIGAEAFEGGRWPWGRMASRSPRPGHLLAHSEFSTTVSSVPHHSAWHFHMPNVPRSHEEKKDIVPASRHPGYEVSQRKRKRVEEIFGWLKTVGLLRKTRHRGLELVGWIFKFATAAYNLVRIRNLAEVT
jgi:Transposase DDE domain